MAAPGAIDESTKEMRILIRSLVTEQFSIIGAGLRQIPKAVVEGAEGLLRGSEPMRELIRGVIVEIFKYIGSGSYQAYELLKQLFRGTIEIGKIPVTMVKSIVTEMASLMESEASSYSRCMKMHGKAYILYFSPSER